MEGFRKKFSAERWASFIFICLGVMSLVESFRLRPLRMRDAVGDDTFPLILGWVLLTMGILRGFILKESPQKVRFPQGRVARKIIGSMVTLFAYWACLAYLGYVISTFLGSMVLFRIFGDYRWRMCAVASAIFTACLYLLFIRFLNMPFPIGILGF